MKLMLAAKLSDLSTLRFPLLVSPKLDGIRAVILGGQVYSRNMKLIPNAYVQGLFGHSRFNGLDGELIVGDPCCPTAFRDTTAGVMSRDGLPRAKFHVFDDCESEYDGFYVRWKMLKKRVEGYEHIHVVGHTMCVDQGTLDGLEALFLSQGYEGAMLRDPSGPYKQGRSTEREGYLMKLKRFEDAEAMVIGFEEQQHNDNAKDASGKRTTHKAGKRPKDTLGALKVVGINGTYKGIEFHVGTGFDDAERAHIWDYRERHHAKIIKFKYFPTGSKDAPRFPVFLGFRDE